VGGDTRNYPRDAADTLHAGMVEKTLRYLVDDARGSLGEMALFRYFAARLRYHTPSSCPCKPNVLIIGKRLRNIVDPSSSLFDKAALIGGLSLCKCDAAPRIGAHNLNVDLARKRHGNVLD